MSKIITGMVLLAWVLSASAAQLNDLRLWASPDSTRVVFDLSGSAEHRLFTLSNPERVVIDLDSTQRAEALASALEGKGVVKRVRTGKRKGGDLRVVLDLDATARSKSFSLAPNGRYGHRVVVDLFPSKSEPSSSEEAPASATKSTPAPQRRDRLEQKGIVVAIDAGHGGEDPGAIGPGGIKEKDVAIGVARRLARLVEQESGFTAVMIRDGDYFVPLRERMNKARKAGADLFISIHANSFRDHRAHGSAVYVLSPRGATSEQARLIAKRENSSDLIGGVHLPEEDDTLKAVLLDIAQTSAIEASLDVGSRILDGLGQVNRLHKSRVQQAGFAVLKAPDIPSVLVETAFISNPREARLLNSADGQYKLAASVMRGIRGYFRDYRPLRYVAAADDHNYIVRNGDTLSHVAHRYRVSLGALRQANRIAGDMLQVGDVLRIPVTN